MPITAPGLGEACGGVGRARGDPEVGDLHLSLRREEHVARLDVAVHDAVAVREVEARGDLGRDPGRVHRREAALCPEDVAERLALDVLHDDEVRAVLLAVVVDADDVGVVEPRRVLRLAAEPLDEAGVARELGEEDLDRDLAVELPVARQEDVGHAAPRDRPLDLVAVREDVSDLGHREITVPRASPRRRRMVVCGIGGSRVSRMLTHRARRGAPARRSARRPAHRWLRSRTIPPCSTITATAYPGRFGRRERDEPRVRIAAVDLRGPGLAGDRDPGDLRGGAGAALRRPRPSSR